MLAHAGPEQRISRPLGRPPNVEAQFDRLDVCSSKHWPILSELQLKCQLFKARSVSQKFFVVYCKCEVGLRVKRIFFEDYHTKAQL